MSPIGHIPTGANGRGGGRRTSLYKGKKVVPDLVRSIPPIMKVKETIDPIGLSGTKGLTTIDRRPGRPTFHHMGPLPDISQVRRRQDNQMDVRINKYFYIKYLSYRNINCFQIPKLLINHYYKCQQYDDTVGGAAGFRMPRRRPYRLQMRHRNAGKNANLGFINRRNKDESNLGYINRRMGFVEDFGDDGLVASESVQDYVKIPFERLPTLSKVIFYNYKQQAKFLFTKKAIPNYN